MSHMCFMGNPLFFLLTLVWICFPSWEQWQKVCEITINLALILNQIFKIIVFTVRVQQQVKQKHILIIINSLKYNLQKEKEKGNLKS